MPELLCCVELSNPPGAEHCVVQSCSLSTIGCVCVLVCVRACLCVCGWLQGGTRFLNYMRAQTADGFPSNQPVSRPTSSCLFLQYLFSYCISLSLSFSPPPFTCYSKRWQLVDPEPSCIPSSPCRNNMSMLVHLSLLLLTDS